MSLDALPMEMVLAISSYLPIGDCMALASTCKLYWTTLGGDEELWKRECHKRWPHLLALHFVQPNKFPDTLPFSLALDQVVDTSQALRLFAETDEAGLDRWRQVAKQCNSGSFLPTSSSSSTVSPPHPNAFSIS